jgi:hypothetical protein
MWATRRSFLAMFVLLLTASHALGDPMNDSLKRRVNDFCVAEFNGNGDKRIMLLLANTREENAVDFVTDPVDIVDSYKVLSVTVKDNSAKVVVEYGLIAEFQNVVYHNYPGGTPEPAVVLNLADKLVIRRNPKFHQELLWRFNTADQE